MVNCRESALISPKGVRYCMDNVFHSVAAVTVITLAWLEHLALTSAWAIAPYSNCPFFFFNIHRSGNDHSYSSQHSPHTSTLHLSVFTGKPALSPLSVFLRLKIDSVQVRHYVEIRGPGSPDLLSNRRRQLTWIPNEVSAVWWRATMEESAHA